MLLTIAELKSPIIGKIKWLLYSRIREVYSALLSTILLGFGLACSAVIKRCKIAVLSSGRVSIILLS